MNGNVVNNSSDIGVMTFAAELQPATVDRRGQGEGSVQRNQPVRHHHLHTKRLRRSVKKGAPTGIRWGRLLLFHTA